MPDSHLPFDAITRVDVTEGELTKDKEAQEFFSETSSLIFGFFGLTLFTLEVEGRFIMGRV